MTKSSYIILSVSLLVVVLITAYLSQPKKKNINNLLLVESSTFQVAGGWGYNVLVDHKIFIHQEAVPAIGGNKIFIKKEDAEKTAALIVQKILNKKVPSVSEHELDSLQVTY
ncbi:MAG: DUF4907 domain-containing protein [Ginsengibacter sp.]